MNMRIALLVLAGLLAGHAPGLNAQAGPNWNVDIGLRGFKYSAEGGPNEIGYNPVFMKWESINQDPTAYAVHEYQALEPLYFNMTVGVDVFLRYKRHLMIKVGYDHSNPLGIGGKGNIAYVDNADDTEHAEAKEFSYTSHQINYFIGPVVPVGEDGGEVYLGFSPMAPTWVTYHERYEESVNDVLESNYDMTFKGFFGSCRALVGIQVPVTEKVKLGSEAVFSFLNYMELESEDLTAYSFRFPMMKWDFTVRYRIR